MGELVKGKIIGVDAGGLTVRIPYADTQRFIRRQYEECTVELQDGRRRSLEQNKKAWALMTEIGEWMGVKTYAIETDVYYPLRAKFAMDMWETLQKRMFRLSQADMSTTSLFIAFLIDFVLDNNIPTKVPLYEHADNIPQYVYSCLTHKRCAVCGKPCDLHHVDRVGMGRNRNEINHIGLRCLPLCRLHHTEAHNIGDAELCSRYHLEPVKIDEEIKRIYKLGGTEK